MKKKVRTKSDVFTWKRLREEVRPILEEIVENTKPKWADSVLTTADKAVGEYKKFDEEKTVLSGQVEDIDERVKKSEQKFGFT